MTDADDGDDYIPFADGRYCFKYGLAQINEIEKKCGYLGALFARLLQGVVALSDGSLMGLNEQAGWGIHDILAPIRQGLIGGHKGIVDGIEVKLTDVRIDELMDNYVLDAKAPLGKSWLLALSAMTGRIVGFDPPKKDEPGVIPAGTESPQASSDQTATRAH